MSKNRPPLALIAGPTASRKSAVALALAERSGGVIVNADSGQVYKDLPILSAAPSEEDKKRAEHRLYGYLEATEPTSAAEWAARAKAEIEDIQNSGKLPILVGGSGLYINTLLRGIAPVPEIDPEIRKEVRAASVPENLKRLEKLDPASAVRLGPNDSARINRALEVALSTGRPLEHWQKQPREGGIEGEVDLKPIALLPPREWLYARCDQRFGDMMRQGAVREVKQLLQRKLPVNLPIMQTIGVREIARHLLGQIDRRAAAIAGMQATRNYAKRQFTWLRHQVPAEWPTLLEPMRSDESINRALASIHEPA